MHAKNYSITVCLIVSTLFVIFFFAGVAVCQEINENKLIQAQESTAEISPVEGEESDTNKAGERVTIFQLILKGGFIGGLIILLSFVALGLVIDYASTINRQKLVPPNDIADFKKLAGEQKSQELMTLTHEKPSFLSHIIRAGLTETHLGYNAMIKAMEDTSEALGARLARKIEHLNIIANISPMMGLLGTVIGMLRCFNDISMLTGSVDPKQLAGGIFEALVTTCLGLIVAIPSLYFYAIFRNRIDEFMGETATAAEEIVSSFKTPVDNERA